MLVFQSYPHNFPETVQNNLNEVQKKCGSKYRTAAAAAAVRYLEVVFSFLEMENAKTQTIKTKKKNV